MQRENYIDNKFCESEEDTSDLPLQYHPEKDLDVLLATQNK